MKALITLVLSSGFVFATAYAGDTEDRAACEGQRQTLTDLLENNMLETTNTSSTNIILDAYKKANVKLDVSNIVNSTAEVKLTFNNANLMVLSVVEPVRVNAGTNSLDLVTQSSAVLGIDGMIARPVIKTDRKTEYDSLGRVTATHLECSMVTYSDAIDVANKVTGKSIGGFSLDRNQVNPIVTLP